MNPPVFSSLQGHDQSMPAGGLGQGTAGGEERLNRYAPHSQRLHSWDG